jgi:hypothetical protein
VITKKCQSTFLVRQFLFLCCFASLSSCSQRQVSNDFFPKTASEAEHLAAKLCSGAGFHDLEPISDNGNVASFGCQKGSLNVSVMTFFSKEEQSKQLKACDRAGTVLKIGPHYLVLNLRSSNAGTDRAGIAGFPGVYGKGTSQPKYEITETSTKAC